MNKKKIESMLPVAHDVLLHDGGCKLRANEKINKSYRSAISSFGAAVTMGSFRAAAAFFSKDADKGDAGISRSELLRTVDFICQRIEKKWRDPGKEKAEWRSAENVCAFVLSRPQNEIKQLEQDFLHAAVALKLAMNAFNMDPEEKQAKGGA